MSHSIILFASRSIACEMGVNFIVIISFAGRPIACEISVL